MMTSFQEHHPQAVSHHVTHSEGRHSVTHSFQTCAEIPIIFIYIKLHAML